jgi:hypothetical protein
VELYSNGGASIERMSCESLGFNGVEGVRGGHMYRVDL